ncbi:MAG: class I SAM-dependent methyltransferase [Sphingomonadales bacterium]|nr:MAG: class I SAM-dependent methyltransferase [Sphingomonadales bacterium]
MADSDHNWRLWGERDPYYGVLTSPQFRKDKISANRQIFFDDGQAFVGHWLTEIERHFGGLPRGRALDFGCGVGRLTIPLSDHFESVTGLDISQGMLNEARHNSADRNIEYLLSDDTLSLVDGTFDFVNSIMVLQHIPVARGMAIMSKLLARVRKGGACLIQVSTKRNHGLWDELRYRFRHHLPGGQAMMNLLERRAADTPVMQMNEYSIDAVLALFRAHGFEDMLVCYERHGSNDVAMIISKLR